MKKFLKNPWTISITTAIFSFMLTVLNDVINGKQVLSTVSSILSTIGNGIVLFLNFNLKVWWVLAGIAVIFVVLGRISNHKNNTKYSNNDNRFAFLLYTQDTIQGWKWEWIWQKDMHGRYDVDELHPICSNCGTPLVGNYLFMDSFECLRCGKKYRDRLPNVDHVKMIIIDSARRDLYPKAGDNQ